MKKIINRSLAWVLALVMVLAIVLVPAPAQVNAAATSTSGNPATDIQNGVTLHAWNWSFNNIIENMATIAAQGYTAIQVPPIQQAKQTTAGFSMSDWWVYYQPAAFCIDNTGNSALGTKAEFTAMCDAAHEYGIYVIVDVVANHMADNGANSINSAVISDLRDDSSCWHDISINISNYYDRYNITQYCLDGVPDLNTSSTKVQGYVLNYLKECVDAGADGFRFDAVKHIETPDDAYCASDFWPNVINGIKDYDPNVYCYGELLYHPEDSGTISDSIYTKYFAVTDNSWSNSVRNNVVCANNAGAFSSGYHKNASANQLVLWAESHDTYAGEGSIGVSIQNINKTWALVAARADAMSLYLARPENFYPQKLGEVTKGGWDAAEVAAVNKFHTAFVGQSEYIANSGSIAYVERGTSGVVLVNCGGTSTTVNVTANKMADGTYIDQITGNTFTVSNGTISGSIGSTGIAVVYNAVQCDHASHSTAGICTECHANISHSYDATGVCSCGKVKPADRVIYFTNSGNWSKVNIYAWNSTGEMTASWPGSSMTACGGNLYTYTLSGEAENVVFNDGSSQSDDLIIPALSTGYNMYDYSTGLWSCYDDGSSCAHASHGIDGKCTTCGFAIGHTYVDGTCSCGAEEPVSIDCVIYFKNTSGWSQPHIYAWSAAGEYAGTWPGSAMTKVEGVPNLYCYTLSADAVNVIFNDGTDDQTSDLTLPTDGKDLYDHSTGSWSTYVPATPRVVYFMNTAGWSAPNIYAWGTDGEYTSTWPGDAMTKVDGVENLYCYTLSPDAVSVIFNYNSTQTDDLVLPTDGNNLFTYSTNSWSVYTETTTCEHESHDVNGVCTGCGETVSHSYVDGSCTVCGDAEPEYGEPITVPSLTLVAPSLNFEDEIYYNVYYTASDMTDVVEMGLITFDGYLAEGTIDDAAEVIPGYTVSGSNYMSHTNGIPSMKLGDALYFRVYAKLSDGTYAYSPTAAYHAVAYAKDILANSTNEKMKALVVAMLNYGAAAQIHFDHNTDSLMNAFLTDEQQALVSDYSSDMVDSVVAADSSKTGNFKAVSGGYSALAPSVAFEGAFAINYYFTPAKTMDGDMKLYYWKQDDYNAADVLTTENATGVVVMEESATAGCYVGAVTGIAAKQIDQTVYVCGVYESNGVSYPTGVIAYSLASYCLDRIAKGSETMQAFAQATVVYGNYAKAYFA